MITIKEFYGDVKDIDESVLAVKSDCLWEKGSLLDIKNLVTPQLFHLHILVKLEIRRLVVYNVRNGAICTLYC